MRGKRCAVRWCRASIRIIPAHAGQTVHDAADGGVHADHPRACGANCASPVTWRADCGSSPRMRGKPGLVRVELTHARIIPAHAGQTCLVCCARCRRSDHPRACGANFFSSACSRIAGGSSPRMRGKLDCANHDALRFRIIPAHAGQTSCRARPPAPPADHPRACGANRHGRTASRGCCGSSPRMRGKHDHGHRILAQRRIIPAHAGQTGCITLVFHPRCGSSPRMRGKQQLEIIEFGALRIIPAHAGQTSSDKPKEPVDSDHPRACGANGDIKATLDVADGSSPRMRGKPTRR